MDSVKILEVKKSVLEDNDADAVVLRDSLKGDGVLYVNIMSSPGSGKTTTLSAVIRRLKDELKIGVMEADIDSDVDAKTIQDLGVRSIQLHTGGMCHLDADMSRQGLKEMGSEDLDLVFLENVGNLVCPAEFDTGAQENVCILSVPEGDDKPLKYPLIFTKCNLVLVNKIDALPVFDFDMDAVKEHIAKINPNAKVIPISAKTGEGLDELMEELSKYAQEGPQLFPDGMTTDQPDAQVCAEIIREKMLYCLDKEIPHGTAVEVTRFSERDNGIIDLDVTIYCEKASHKGIIIGKHGDMMKRISSLARQDIERFMGTKVYMETWVKVKENWRDNVNFIRAQGYNEE